MNLYEAVFTPKFRFSSVTSKFSYSKLLMNDFNIRCLRFLASLIMYCHVCKVNCYTAIYKRTLAECSDKSCSQMRCIANKAKPIA